MNLLAELERYERQATDMRFSSALRSRAFRKAEALRRRIAR